MLKTLIIEDEVNIRELLKLDLEISGLCSPIVECANAELALQYLENNLVDLIFLDIQMPRMKGITFLNKLRAQNDQTSVIILSADTTFENAQRAIELKVDAFVNKPWNTDQILNLVAKIHLKVNNSDPQFVFFKSGHENLKIQVSTINYVTSEGNYSWIHTDDSKKLLTHSLKNVEDQLMAFNSFRRIDRFNLVNFSNIISWDSLQCQITFANKEKTNISKNANKFIDEWHEFNDQKK